MKTHKDLDVWKLSMELAKKIYILTREFPKEEVYGLVSQMRRAAISVPSNIAEGAARNSKKEFIQLLYIALGSVSELETQYFLSKEFNYINENNKTGEHIERVRQTLLGLIKFLKNKT